MVKKIDERKILIKHYMQKGFNQSAISKMTGIPRQSVNHLVHQIEDELNGIIKEKKIKTKLPIKHYNKIISMAEKKQLANSLKEKSPTQ